MPTRQDTCLDGMRMSVMMFLSMIVIVIDVVKSGFPEKIKDKDTRIMTFQLEGAVCR